MVHLWFFNARRVVIFWRFAGPTVWRNGAGLADRKATIPQSSGLEFQPANLAGGLVERRLGLCAEVEDEAVEDEDLADRRAAQLEVGAGDEAQGSG